ncbi:MAG: BolA family protein [Gammaproteobacteria bacterium]
MQAEQLKDLIEKAIGSSEVTIQGDGDHFEAVVVTPEFEGKSMVQQHQMVYQVLGDLMQAEIHALALHTYTPEQWSKQKRIQ